MEDLVQFDQLEQTGSKESEAKEEAPRTTVTAKTAQSEPTPNKTQGKSESSPKKGSRKLSKPKSPLQKERASLLKKAGINESQLPSLEHLVREKQGARMKVSDIAVFIDEPENPALKLLYKDMRNINRVNPSAPVGVKRVRQIAPQILKAGRMYQPVLVARAQEDGRLECISGRHRLVFLAMVYGADAEIPVYVENMSLNEARDAVAVSNQSRRVHPMERTKHTVYQAVHGDVDAEQEEMFRSTAVNKTGAIQYATYSVFERGNPISTEFGVSMTNAKAEGELATLRSVQRYLEGALAFDRSMTREQFDKEIQDAVNFLNRLVRKFQENDSFDCDQQMCSQMLKSLGSYYKSLKDAGANVDDAFVQKLSDMVVALGKVGRRNVSELYTSIVQEMKK